MWNLLPCQARWRCMHAVVRCFCFLCSPRMHMAVSFSSKSIKPSSTRPRFCVLRCFYSLLTLATGDNLERQQIAIQRWRCLKWSRIYTTCSTWEGKKGFFVFLFSCHMPDVSLQKPVLSHILVTVATFDKRAYKYIFRLSFNKLLCTEWPSPASPGPHWYSESFVILEQMKETSCLFFLNIFRRNPLTEKSWIQVALCGSCWVTTLKPLRGA